MLLQEYPQGVQRKSSASPETRYLGMDWSEKTPKTPTPLSAAGLPCVLYPVFFPLPRSRLNLVRGFFGPTTSRAARLADAKAESPQAQPLCRCSLS